MKFDIKSPQYFSVSRRPAVFNRMLSMVVCLMIGLLVCQHATADEIVRRSAKSGVKGKIQKITPAEIVLKPRSGADIKIPVNDIIRIRFDGEPPSLNLARTSELNGALERALEGFTKAKAAVKNNKNLAAEVDFLIARTNARLATGSTEKMQTAVQQLTDFVTKQKTNIRFYEAINLLSALHLQSGELAKAREVASPLKNAPVKSLKMTAQIIEGRALLAEQKPAEAAAAFQAANAMAGNDPAEKAKALECLLGTAMCQQVQKQFEPAIATLDQVLDKIDVKDTVVQAEAYLRRGDVYRAQGKTKEAVYEYLHVDLLFSAHKALHAEALFNLAQLWSVNGHADRAAEARATLTSDYGASSWAKKLAGG